MRKMFKLLILTMLTFFAFNFNHVIADVLDGESINEATEQMNVLDQSNSEVEVKADTETVKAENENKEQVLDTPVVEETKAEETKTEETDNTTREAEVPTEEPAPTKDAGEPEPTVTPQVIIHFKDERQNKVTYDYIDKATNHGKTLKITDLKVGIGDVKKDYLISDGIIYQIEGYYLPDGTKLSSSPVTVGEVKISQNPIASNACGVYISTGKELTTVTEFVITIKWTERTQHKVTVNVIDSRNNNTIKTLTTKELAGYNTTSTLKNMFSTITDDFQIISDTEITTFKGFYTAAKGGDKIDKNYTPGGDYSSLKVLASTSDGATPSAYTLKLEAADSMSTDEEVNIYVQWDIEEIEQPQVTEHTVTVKVIDTRNNKTTSFTTTNTSESAEGMDLKSMVPEIGEDFKIVTEDAIYTFAGFYTTSGDAKASGVLIDKNFTPGELYPELSELYATSDATTPASYYLYAKALSTLAEDPTINVYIRWNEEDVTPDEPGEPEEPTVEPKVTISFVDTRDNSTLETTLVTTPEDTQSQYVTLATLVPGLTYNSAEKYYSMTVKNEDGTEDLYIFRGFFTAEENGVQIDRDFKPGTDYPELADFRSLSAATAAGNYKFFAKAIKTLDVEKGYNVYLLWDVYPTRTITINYYDVKPDKDPVIVETITRKITPKTSWNSLTTIDQVFGENDSNRPYTGVNNPNDNTETDKQNKNITYTFIGWYDAATNGVKIENGYVLSGVYAKVLAQMPLPAGTTIKKRVVGDTLYEISFGTLYGNQIDGDYELNFYAYWEAEEGTYLKIQNLNYINEYGRTSWSNHSSADGYSHRYDNPKDTATHQFLYWKVYDENDKEYDGVEYRDGARFTFDFHNPVQEPGHVTELTGKAWWKAVVTLNLYDGKTLLGTNSLFDSISISDVLEKDPEKFGYEFLGWVDADGKEVTEKTFKANKPDVNPEVKVVNLYANWKQIKRDITVSKEWDDRDDENKIRPDSVTVNLMNGEEKVDTIVLSDENEWTYTFTVVKFDTEKEIQYTVKEEEIKGYTPKVTGDMEKGFVITNTHVPTRDVTVNKVWDDKDNYNGKRPETVMIILLADGEEVNSTLLSEENGWTYTFEGLEKYNGNSEIKYTIDEVEVEDYWVEVTGDMEKGFTVTNSYFGEGGNDDPGTEPEPEPETTPSSNPKTGDNIYNYITLLLISLAGLIKFSKSYLNN